MPVISQNQQQLIVELLRPGDIFGMLLTLATEKLPAQLSARSLGKSKILWMPIENFLGMIVAHPKLSKEFAAHLLVCLQSSYCLSRGLAHDRVDVRIAAILSSLALKSSTPNSSTGRPVISFTRQQLADLTGTTPETAIRVTRAMQRNGLIDMKRPGIITILNHQALQELVEES